ncbi:hypothetical protein BGW38_010917 [Lunasporangiospora selenospora]|uniref:Uncharacterized protein n=1 Tax=Lunasporangiospora selenospora TaxID=979761 RepID=A0A9P6FWH5_9FUNG|nr:hypothetical protein BGW38_010917 [Lunasporangiospora selenospora]
MSNDSNVLNPLPIGGEATPAGDPLPNLSGDDEQASCHSSNLASDAVGPDSPRGNDSVHLDGPFDQGRFDRVEVQSRPHSEPQSRSLSHSPFRQHSWTPYFDEQFEEHIRSGNPDPCHGEGVFYVGDGGVVNGASALDEVYLHTAITQELAELDVPTLSFLHTREYLTPVSNRDPLLQLRLVFRSYQLPRGPDFARKVAPIQRKHMIDTYLIPHESTPHHADHDVVLGLAGSLDRVCHGLEELLLSIAPPECFFSYWQLCLLIPHDIHFLFIGSYDKTLVYDVERDIADSSIPALRAARGRRYGQIPDARDEHVFAIQSMSLEKIMSAIRCVGEILIGEQTTLETSREFYQGGCPSVIPSEFLLRGSILHHTTAMDRNIPMGYIVRPEMMICLQYMALYQYHLQLHLDPKQARAYSEHGDMSRKCLHDLGVGVRVSSAPTSSNESYRVLNIGGRTIEAVTRAAAEVAEWMSSMSLANWVIKIYVPWRAVTRIEGVVMTSEQKTQKFSLTPHLLEVKEQDLSLDSQLLVPSEQEWLLDIGGVDRTSIQHGLDIAVSMIYNL